MLAGMSFDDGLDDNEPGYRAPLPPDDRLWRHPSEVTTRRPRHGLFEQRPWALALLAGLVGAMLASGLVVALGIDRRHPVTERVLEPDTSGASSDDAVVSVMERVRPAIVQVVAQHPDTALTGSGFLFRDDGYLLTDERLVAGATSLAVTLNDGRRLPGRPVGTDADTAVGVVKVDGSRFPIAPLGTDANLKLGQQAIAVGSPSGPSGTPWVSVAILLLGRAWLGGAESFIITGALSWGLALIGPHNTGKVMSWVGTALYAAFAVGAWVCTPNDRLARVGVDVAVPVPVTVIVRGTASVEPAACVPSGRATPATAAAPISSAATMSMRFIESSVSVSSPEIRRRCPRRTARRGLGPHGRDPSGTSPSRRPAAAERRVVPPTARAPQTCATAAAASGPPAPPGRPRRAR